ncbi:hypothetical protein I4U23_005218 [Adineta vaga]|nr:hypothetical protein I4U23_005218 [Adineta vaga]
MTLGGESQFLAGDIGLVYDIGHPSFAYRSQLAIKQKILHDWAQNENLSSTLIEDIPKRFWRYDQNKPCLIDFRKYGSAQFQAIAGFCRFAKTAVDQIISSSYSNTLLKTEILSQYTLQYQIQAWNNQFRLTSSSTDAQFRFTVTQDAWYMQLIASGYFQDDNDACFCGLHTCTKVTPKKPVA